jgi:hypothetical protein
MHAVAHYLGTRSPAGADVVRVHADGSTSPLDPRYDLGSHGFCGFEWGYGGSGPSQLALALLADATGDDDLAAELHAAFKWARVAALAHAGWTMTRDEVRAWVVDYLEDATIEIH